MSLFCSILPSSPSSLEKLFITACLHPVTSFPYHLTLCQNPCSMNRGICHFLQKACFSCLFSFLGLFSLKLIFLGSNQLPSTPRKYPLTANLNYLPPSLYYEILYTDLYLTLAIISPCDYKLF